MELTTSHLLEKNDEAALSGFFNGALEGAYKEPFRGISQLLGAREASEQRSGLENASHSVGRIVGSLVPFALLSLAARGASLHVLGQELVPSLYRRIGEHTTTGFLLGSIFTPSELKPGQELYSTRLAQGGVSALTFATMTGSAGLIHHCLPAAGSETLALGLAKRVSIAAFSGAAGGIVDLECRTGFKANRQELNNSALGYAAFGSLMELGSFMGGRVNHNNRPEFESKDFTKQPLIKICSKNDASAKQELPRLILETQEHTSKDHVCESPKTPLEREEAKPKIQENDLALDLALINKKALPLARGTLLNELKEFKIQTDDGPTLNLYQCLMQMRFLSDAQKTRILDVLSQVRNHYAELNDSDCPVQRRAQNRWILSQAAVGEVFRELIDQAKHGTAPVPLRLENKILVRLFSQFRSFIDEPYIKPTEKSLRSDRSAACKQILSNIGYPESQVAAIVSNLNRCSLNTQALDNMTFDSRKVREFKTFSDALEGKLKVDNEQAVLSANLELMQLNEQIQNAFPRWSSRIQRLTKLLGNFVDESKLRGLNEAQEAGFYHHLNRLFDVKADSVLAIHERRDLAEQVLNHAAFPSTIDQGANNTCSVATLENRIYTRNPELMAKMIADLADSGAYITKSGKVVELSKLYEGLRPDREARTSRRNQAVGHNAIKLDGGRDWASQLAQVTMAKINVANYWHYIMDNTVIDQSWFAFDGKRKLLGFINPQDVIPVVNSKGKPFPQIVQFSQGPFFKMDGHYVQELAPSELIYDKHGWVRGSICDQSKIKVPYDYFGERVRSISQRGQTLFDKSGTKLFFEAMPGEATYFKWAIDRKKEAERIFVEQLGNKKLLKEISEKKAKIINYPSLPMDRFEYVHSEITGSMDENPFILRRAERKSVANSILSVSSPEELAAGLKRIIKEKNFPAIILVNASKEPWEESAGLDDGWHVVNIQGYDPQSKMVKITNQWGSEHDFMEPGLHLDKLYDSMK